MEAGAAHGVKEDSVFEIFSSDTISTYPLCSLTVAKRLGVVSELDNPQAELKIPPIFYAKQILDEIVSVYCADAALAHRISSGSPQITLTNSKAKADIEISVENSNILLRLTRHDILSDSRPAIDFRFLAQAKDSELLNFLGAAVRFEYYRRIPDGSEALAAQVHIELKALDRNGPQGNNLLEGKAAVIPIKDDGHSDPMCFKIKNDSNVALFVHAFYFSDDLSISEFIRQIVWRVGHSLTRFQHLGCLPPSGPLEEIRK